MTSFVRADASLEQNISTLLIAGCLAVAAISAGRLSANEPSQPSPETQYRALPYQHAWFPATQNTGSPYETDRSMPMLIPPGDGQAQVTSQQSSDPLPAEEKTKPATEQAWVKDGFKIIPYGSLWGSTLYTTRRAFPGPYTLFVLPLNEQGEPDFFLDTRRTRLGLDVIGPRLADWGDAQTGGKVEIDFHGAFIVENRPGVLLRHAYGEIKNDQARLLAGQAWDVISPLNPGTISYSVMWAQGNIGYRRAQIRLERYLELPADYKFTAQGSINQNIISDFADEPGVVTESVDWPLLQGRVALTDESPIWGGGPVTLGISGHIGEQGFDFVTVGPPPLNLPPADDVRLRTWSFNVDLYMPLTKRCGLQGEYFIGENLSTFLGGIVQGVCPCLRRPIRSHGGWVELWYDWSETYHSHVGYGVDDPNVEDMLFGRTYNQFLFANIIYDVTSYLMLGFEVSLAKTTYRETRPDEPIPVSGEAVGFEFTGQYVF